MRGTCSLQIVLHRKKYALFACNCKYLQVSEAKCDPHRNLNHTHSQIMQAIASLQEKLLQAQLEVDSLVKHSDECDATIDALSIQINSQNDQFQRLSKTIHDRRSAISEETLALSKVDEKIIVLESVNSCKDEALKFAAQQLVTLCDSHIAKINKYIGLIHSLCREHERNADRIRDTEEVQKQIEFEKHKIKTEREKMQSVSEANKVKRTTL